MRSCRSTSFATETVAIRIPRHPIHTGRRLSPQPAIGRSQQFDIDMVQQGGEPFLLSLPCCCPYAIQPVGHAFPSRCPAHAGLDHVPLGPSEGFTTADDYLKHLTYVGAQRKYQSITEEVRNRIEFELSEIKITGYAGYFLIVQDFIAAAKRLDVWVGPGRGSAASSIVAYCTGITNIDPIGYKLLFERFLTSERVSMPDIDIDFDDKGRERVIQYVVDKYGRERVAQIVTIGTMAAKSAVKDVARTLKVPLADANRLTKMIPFGAKDLYRCY